MSDKYPGGLVTAAAPAGYSVFFDGTGDYLTIPAGVAFAPGTGDFTIEAWVYPTATGDRFIWTQTASGTNYFIFAYNDTGAYLVATASGGGTAISGPTVRQNSWNHIAAVRSSGTVRVYVNGIGGTGTSNTTDLSNTTYVPTVGTYTHSTSTNPLTGYLSSLRYVKGTAIYTANFTPPTQLFSTSIAGSSPSWSASLLTCQSPTIIDNSSNAFALTVNGNAAVSTFSPFPSSYYFYNAPTDGNTRSMVPSNIAGFNPAYGAAAPGVWTLDQAQYFAANRLWPIYDPYFNLTTLMLPGDGTNGAQNNTFLDSSTNNFTITRNGNTTQGTFSPFSQTGWSNYFNRSNYTNIYAASSADFNFGSGDFTIECFFNPSYVPASGDSTFTRLFDTGQVTCFFFSGNIYFRNAASAELVTVVAHGLSVGVWYHLAFVRSGTTYLIFRNGIQLTSGTGGTITSASAPFVIGANASYSQPLDGYVSDFRVTTGQALYTSTFTPATTPLTTTSQSATASNVKLLTCQSNRFVDNSTQSTKTILLGDNGANPGTRFVQPFSPFLPTIPYSAATVGGSAYFDGTGDTLVTPTIGTSIGTGDWCLEGWVYTGSASTSFVTFITLNNSSGYPIFLQTSANAARFLDFQNPGTNFIISGGTVNNNAWTHIVGSRQSGTVRLFVGGVLVANQTGVTFNYGTAGTATIASSIAEYLSGIRITIGSVPTAYQTSSTTNGTQIFSVPTAPPTAVTNTQLLLNFTNAGIIDATSDNVLETVGNAQISTAQSKFGGSSMYFDGNGDYLYLPPRPLLALGSGDFTVECWVNVASPNDSPILETRATSSATNGFTLTAFSSTVIRIFTSSALISATVPNYSSTWTHIAVVKSGTTTTLYVNGTSGGTTTSLSGLTNTDMIVGGGRYGTVGSATVTASLNGYIDDLRVTNGFARYTANFVPPTSALQLQ